jgi:hypothetical protein
MKKFTDIKREQKVFEAEGNLPSNYKEFTKDELINLLNGGKEEAKEENEEAEDVKEVETEETETKEEETKDVAKEDSDMSNPVKLFSKLFESREMAHIYHLQVNGEEGSHAYHVALNTYYEDILEHIDTLIEMYSGQYGIVDGYDIIDTNSTRTKDKVAYFEDLAEFVKYARKAISAEDTHLQNVIDEVVGLIYRTLYKLKFMK